MNTQDLIINYLKEGKEQHEISKLLKDAGIRPNSLSHVEKALKVIKERHGAKTMFHLGAILTKFGGAIIVDDPREPDVQAVKEVEIAQLTIGDTSITKLIDGCVQIVTKNGCIELYPDELTALFTFINAQFATDAGGGIIAKAKEFAKSNQLEKMGTVEHLVERHALEKGFIAGSSLTAPSTHSSSEMVDVEKVIAIVKSWWYSPNRNNKDILIRQISKINEGSI